MGSFTYIPAVDPMPFAISGVPETRMYTFVSVVNDREVGQRSPAVSVVVN